MQIKKRLNEDFENLCDWFIDNKLSIHFDEDKKKSILFASKLRANNIGHFNKYKTTFRSIVVLGEMMSGDPMALKFINKINGKLKFLYRKNRSLVPKLR